MTLFDNFRQLLGECPAAPPDGVGAPFERRQLAVVALLIELAQADRHVEPAETETIERIVRERFGLDAAVAERLIAAAHAEFDAALEDWIFAKAVRDGFDLGERVEIVELLWEVVYADGCLVRLEESSMRRLAAQLGIDDAAREAARAQAFARSRQAGSVPGATEVE